MDKSFVFPYSNYFIFLVFLNFISIYNCTQFVKQNPNEIGIDHIPCNWIKDNAPKIRYSGLSGPNTQADIKEISFPFFLNLTILPEEYFNKYFAAMVIDLLGGGIAVGDYDNDGWEDIFMTGLDNPPKLYRNTGKGTFVDATPSDILKFNMNSNGACWGDIDNDNDLDLYVTILGPANGAPNDRNYLFVNQGKGVFTEEAIQRGVAVKDNKVHFMTSCTFGDYDLDGYVDLHVGQWHGELIWEGHDVHTRLFHNRGTPQPGYYDDVSDISKAKPSKQLEYVFSSTFTDFDGDLYPDLLMVSDFTTTRLYWNQRDGTFQVFECCPNFQAMGLAIGDFDNNLILDFFMSEIYFPFEVFDLFSIKMVNLWDRLMRNNKDKTFTLLGDKGVNNGGWGWGTSFIDYDNDGDLDLVETNGYIVGSIDYVNVSNRFWVNEGRDLPMPERAAELGFGDKLNGHCLVTLDYDKDGDLDIVVSYIEGTFVYKNEGPVGDWIKVKTKGTVSNTYGIGAQVTIQPQHVAPLVRHIGSDVHFLGQSELTAHFGLGSCNNGDPAAISVLWPVSKRVIDYENVPANSILYANEDDACVNVQCPPSTDKCFYSLCRGKKGEAGTCQLVPNPYCSKNEPVTFCPPTSHQVPISSYLNRFIFFGLISLLFFLL